MNKIYWHRNRREYVLMIKEYKNRIDNTCNLLVRPFTFAPDFYSGPYYLKEMNIAIKELVELLYV